MTMKFVQDVKNEINTLFPDNNIGQITPAILRLVTQDMTDSLYARLAALYRVSATPVAQALTTTPTNYPALYDTASTADPAVISANLVPGTIVPNVTGFSTILSFSLTVDGANGRIVAAVIAKNGTVINRSRILVTCTGAGAKESNSTAIPFNGIVAGDIFTALLSVDTGASINISNVSLDIVVQPTYSAV